MHSEFNLYIKAAECGSIERFNKFFKEDYLNKSYEGGRRAIHFATVKGFTEIVEILIEHKCDIESKDLIGHRPIHYACQNGYLGIVRYLLNNQCDIEACSSNNNRPIHYACRYGHREIVELLIDKKCDIKSPGWMNYHPIHYACDNGDFDIVNLLITNNCDFEARNKDNWRPIHHSCAYGHEGIANLLLTRNCDIEACTSSNWRPIHLACENGHLEIVKLLINNNCNLNMLTDLRETPLDIARKNKNQLLIGIINKSKRNELERKEKCVVKINEFLGKVGYSWQNKIFSACKNGEFGIVDELIKQKENIEICDKNGRKPIHWACEGGQIEIVRLLIKHNCNIEAKDKGGCSPIDLANLNGNGRMIDIINTEIESRRMEKQISEMNLECGYQCDHKFCSTSLRSKNFQKGYLIGRGSFGKIYRCKSSNHVREFALKVISTNNIESQSIEANINQYVNILHHYKVIRYFGCIEKNNNLNIFMDYLAGGSLQDKIRNHKYISFSHVIDYSTQTLEGISFLHEQKIIHRDIKPSNILFDMEDNLKLSDLDFGRLIDKSDAKTFCGTANFMAPEIMNGEQYTFPADIWSFGATVINMTTGKPPYHDLISPAVVFKIASSKKIEFQPVEQLPSSFKKFIDCLLKPNPSDRPTARELLNHEIFKNFGNILL